MKLFHLLTAFLLIFAAANAAAHPGVQHDSHKLSAEELHVFLPAVCRNATRTKSGFDCAELYGYSPRGAAFDVQSGKATGEIALDAVAYGSFTGVGRNEAYLTYSGLEAHVCNFGGGILLRRTNGAWDVVRWSCGGQMDKCIALPGDGPQRMLCLDGWEGMGEIDSAVTVESLAELVRGGHHPGDVRILAAQNFADGDETQEKYVCQKLVPQNRSMLLSIGDLVRASEPGILATSNVKYATAADVAVACAHSRLSNIPMRSGVVHYVLHGNTVVAEPKRDYAVAE